MTNQQPITAAVIGCGAISAEHFAAIAGNPNVVLTAVSDTDPGRLAAASTAYTCQGYSDYQTMLVAQRPDVVHICTPHHLHAEMAIRCLEQNINVLLESRWQRRWPTRLPSSKPRTGARPLSGCVSRTATTPRRNVCGRSLTLTGSGRCIPLWRRSSGRETRRTTSAGNGAGAGQRPAAVC